MGEEKREREMAALKLTYLMSVGLIKNFLKKLFREPRISSYLSHIFENHSPSFSIVDTSISPSFVKCSLRLTQIANHFLVNSWAWRLCNVRGAVVVSILLGLPDPDPADGGIFYE